ncbi:hypothetical protein O181_072211 [Austropuccinia psidii MF-1]|uniref:Uncharacterized protein n=1 Tax=Austropuccinia psidii MF-1 TaxID=1389203 RepID=A0A9Q3I774_9BASI|nr:hypothetical protein [Austropuccinia psidii MF-1]
MHFPQHIPLTLPPHLCPHQSLCFHTPAPYHPYAPEAPSIYASNATVTPPHPLCAYHPYTTAVPSRYASNAATPPYAVVFHTDIISFKLTRGIKRKIELNICNIFESL